MGIPAGVKALQVEFTSLYVAAAVAAGGGISGDRIPISAPLNPPPPFRPTACTVPRPAVPFPRIHLRPSASSADVCCRLPFTWNSEPGTWNCRFPSALSALSALKPPGSSGAVPAISGPPHPPARRLVRQSLQGDGGSLGVQTTPVPFFAAVPDAAIRHSDFGIDSSFGPRISSFPPPSPPCVPSIPARRDSGQASAISPC
jgi:hypothetical protein